MSTYQEEQLQAEPEQPAQSHSPAELEALLGYKFKDSSLLDTALTHSTWAYEHPKAAIKENERLEFLGDSVLGLTISTHLYQEEKQLPEGHLSKIRAQIVREETLYQVARDIHLNLYIKLGVGERRSGGEAKPSNLSDCLEAIFGAIYLDAGFASAFEIITKLFKNYYQLALAGQLNYDYKTSLLEKVQALGPDHRVEFRLVDEIGPVHDRTFTTCVYIDGKPYGQGSGHSKKRAEQKASEQTLDML